ncbi:MAG: phytanoyl-CoA dioxygenase family protein [Proteobacteria bacterium]|nr:phytanoyl-CoA dioxygenase family protein [Pseudomonadota bacterium]
MWCRLKSRISAGTIDALLERAADLISNAQQDNSITFGKDFFGRIDSQNNNLDLLQRLHQDFWPEIADIVNLKLPVVDHTSLLIKGAGAPGTALHQDRAYWVSRDPEPTIFSVWIALEDLTEEKGGLILTPANQVSVDGMSAFNTGSIIEHTQDYKQAGGFPITVPVAAATEMKQSMEFISLAKGEALAFDSFEAHTTGPNQTTTPRLAMKIAYSDGTDKDYYLMRTDQLVSLETDAGNRPDQ